MAAKNCQLYGNERAPVLVELRDEDLQELRGQRGRHTSSGLRRGCVRETLEGCIEAKFWKVNMGLKALAEIYKMHSFALL